MGPHCVHVRFWEEVVKHGDVLTEFDVDAAVFHAELEKTVSATLMALFLGFFESVTFETMQRVLVI
jgi:hypothetical protein